MNLDIKPLQGGQELEVNVSFRIPRGGANHPGKSFEQIEENLVQTLNQIGSGTTQELLRDYDTNGDTLKCEQGKKWTSKGPCKRIIETPYGPVSILAHVYQTSAGGRVRTP